MKSFYHHTAYGLRLRSDQLLPGLASAGESTPDVTIEFAGRDEAGADMSDYEPLARRDTETFWDLGGRGCLLRYTDPDSDDLIDIRLNRADSHIRVTWTASVVAEHMPLVVLQPVLNAALHLLGVPCLHASAVSARGRAALFMGPSGAGKSTTAAALARQGHTLLSDDVAALDQRGGADGVWVQPGYPRLRLSPDTAHALGWAPDARPSPWVNVMVDNKADLHLPDPLGPFCSQPSRVAALYVLGQRQGGRHALVTPLPPRRALPHLVENIYTARWQDAARRAGLFRFCARLAETVPVYHLRLPDGLADLAPALQSALAHAV